jgi:hypothetical protein
VFHFHHHAGREDLLEANRLEYALFDFDVSIKFDKDIDLKNCRLPYHRSFFGGILAIPPDVKQGELEYNPFVYDMGFLGIFFESKFTVSCFYLKTLRSVTDTSLYRE